MLAIHGSKFVEQTPNISPISRNYLLGNCNRFGTAMYGLYEHRKATRLNCRGVWCGFARPVMKMRSAGATSPCRNSMLLLTLYLHICFDLPAHFMGNRIECLGGKRPDQAVADTLPGPADSLHGTGRLRRHGQGIALPTRDRLRLWRSGPPRPSRSGSAGGWVRFIGGEGGTRVAECVKMDGMRFGPKAELPEDKT